MVNPMTKPLSISSKSLIGAVIKNQHGEVLGEIEELLVNLGDGCIFNLIISTHGLLSKKRVAISWDMLKVDEMKAIRLDVEKDFLHSIPAYHGD